MTKIVVSAIVFGVILAAPLLSLYTSTTTVFERGTIRCPSWLVATRCRLRCLEHQLTRLTTTRISEPSVYDYDGVGKLRLQETVDAAHMDTAGMRMCTQDATCSSCLMPCDKDDVELENCDEICRDAMTKSKLSCDASCEFVANVTCSSTPMSVQLSSVDSSTKCGTSTRTTKVASSAGDNESGIQTMPDDGNIRPNRTRDASCLEVENDSFEITRVMVSESWETRGIHVRWKVKETPCCDRRRSPIIYAIQMQQLVGGIQDKDDDDYDDDEFDTSDWTVLTTTMSKSLNLVNVLTLGLTYKLRIVAVSSSSIRCVSSASRPFGLPKEVPVPGAPRNLSFSRSKSGVVSVTVYWESPAASKPAVVAVSDYLVTSIEESGSDTAEETVLLDARQRARSTSPTNSGGPRTSHGRHSYKLVNVDPNATYVFQIRAVIELGGRQFIGEAAVLKVHPMRKRRPTPASAAPNAYIGTNQTAASASSAQTPPLNGEDHDDRSLPMSIDNLTVRTPFYWNGSLRAIIAWNHDNAIDLRGVAVVQRFILRAQTISCASFAIESHKKASTGINKHVSNKSTMMESRRNSSGHHVSAHPSKMIYIDSGESTYQLGGLDFQCVYKVNVAAVSALGLQSPMSHTYFETPPCYQGSTVPSFCPMRAPKNLVCEVKTSKTEDLELRCFWEWATVDDDDTLGFLVVATPYVMQSVSNESSARKAVHQTVSNDGDNEVTLRHNLVPNSKYHVSVRAIARGGERLVLGPPAQLQRHIPFNYPLGALYDSSMASHQSTTRSTLGSSARRLIYPTFECLSLIACIVLSSRGARIVCLL